MEDAEMEELVDAFKDGRYLIKIDADRRDEVFLDVVRQARREHFGVVCVTTQQPYLFFQNKLDAADVGRRSIRYVDTIMKTVAPQVVEERSNVIYLPSSGSIGNITVAAMTAANALETKNNVLIVDGFESLFTYNTVEAVAAFLVDLDRRLETNDLNMVTFLVDDAIEDRIGSELYDVINEVAYLR